MLESAEDGRPMHIIWQLRILLFREFSELREV